MTDFFLFVSAVVAGGSLATVACVDAARRLSAYRYRRSCAALVVPRRREALAGGLPRASA